MPPPASKNAAITAVHSSRSTRSAPTLNVIQLPRPTTGNGSPVDGTGLVIGRRSCASPAGGRAASAPVVAAIAASTARRVGRDLGNMKGLLTHGDALHLFPTVGEFNGAGADPAAGRAITRNRP